METTASKQPSPQPQPSPLTSPTTFTCEICIEPLSNNHKFESNHQCDHFFCIDCVTKYITLKVTDDLAYDVTCPGPTCEFKLDPLISQQHLSQATFIKWCDNLCDEAILVSGLDRCYCPNRECSTLVTSECEGDIRKTTCPNCKKLFCFKCGVTWHSGYKCEETVDIRDQNDIEFGVLAKQKKWMRCPKCRHYVDRVAGCNIVKCRCQTHFCYKCGKMITDRCNCGDSNNCVFIQVLLILSVIIILVWLIVTAINRANASNATQ